MSSTIVINQSNLVADGFNNTFIYKFPNSVQFKDSEIAVSSLTMYFSWANISQIFQNQVFTYTWVVGTTPTTYTITIPSGLYEIADINNYFQYNMIQNGTYLINSAGQNVYYAEFLVNPNSYAIQLNTFPVPTSLPTGWTAPTAVPATGAVAFPGYPTTATNVRVQIPASSKFNTIVGFPSGFDTGTSTAGTNLSFLSTIAPQVQPNPSIYVGISNISNKYANPSTIIYSVSPSVGFGEKIVERMPEFTWNRMLSGTYSELRLQFLGVDMSPIQLLDPNISVLLSIRERTEK
jgi:hypothetical protein